MYFPEEPDSAPDSRGELSSDILNEFDLSLLDESLSEIQEGSTPRWSGVRIPGSFAEGSFAPLSLKNFVPKSGLCLAAGDASQNVFQTGMDGSQGIFQPRIDASQDIFQPGIDASQDIFQPGIDASQGIFQPGIDAFQDIFHPGIDASQGIFQPRIDASQDIFQPGINASQDIFQPGIDASESIFQPGIDAPQDSIFQPGQAVPLEFLQQEPTSSTQDSLALTALPCARTTISTIPRRGKPRAYEWLPQTDPEMEKKRQRALKAFNNRQKVFQREQAMQERLVSMRKLAAQLQSEKEELERKLLHLDAQLSLARSGANPANY